MREMLLKINDKFGMQAIGFYIVIGGLSLAINFVSFAICWNLLHLHYKWAVTISYVLTILFNFLGNRCFTFRSTGSHLTRHLYRYLIMILLNYAITLFFVHVAIKWFAVSPYIGLIVSAGMTTFTGFALSKFWVYSTR